jgi:hypothetical protein
MGDAILEVLALYCRAIDRCDAELLRRLYWPEAIEDRGYFSGDRDAFVAWDAFAFGALHISVSVGPRTVSIASDPRRRRLVDRQSRCKLLA